MSDDKVVNSVIPSVIEMLEEGVTNVMYFEGTLTKDPDWATRKTEDGEVVLSDSEFVTFTVLTGGSYHSVRAFDEALVNWALGLGGGARVAVSAELVNQAPKKGGRWSSYMRALDVQCLKHEDRKAGVDREGAVERRKAAEAAGPKARVTRIHA